MSKIDTALRLVKGDRKKLRGVIWEKTLGRFVFYLPLRSRIKWRYRSNFGRNPDLRHPRLQSEKIQWRKMYCPQIRLLSVISDKVQAYDFVRGRIGGQHLNTILWSGKQLTPDIVRSLGDNVIYQPTARSGQVFKVSAVSKISPEKLCALINPLLKWPYSMLGEECWYGQAQQTIAARPLVYWEGGPEYVCDVKMHIFQNSCSAQQVIVELIDHSVFIKGRRQGEDQHWRVMLNESGEVMSFNWNPSDYPLPVVMPELPYCFDQLVENGKKLAEGIDYVRVDFLVTSEDYYFSEMTFAPTGGMMHMEPNEWDLKIGEMWDLDIGNFFKRFIWKQRAWLPLWKLEFPMRALRRLATKLMADTPSKLYCESDYSADTELAERETEH